MALFFLSATKKPLSDPADKQPAPHREYRVIALDRIDVSLDDLADPAKHARALVKLYA